MKKLLLFFLLLFFSCINTHAVYCQGVTHVQIVGANAVSQGETAIYEVNFWNGATIVHPSGGLGYLWSPSGASINYETFNTISLTYNAAGTHTLVFQYMTYDGNFNDNIQVRVTAPNPCAEVIPSSSEGSRFGRGSLTLTADPAPSGFSYRWFDEDQSSLLATDQAFTTPVLESSKIYYLAYYHVASGCQTDKVAVNALISGHNYVKKFTARDAGLTEASIQTSSNTQSYKDITYYDGLGRPMQNIKQQATSNGKDLITPISYDAFGRQAKEYLPYYEATGLQDGSYRSNAVGLQSQRSPTIYGDVNAYTEKAFEPSPLNRIDQQAAPGEAWKLGSGHEVKFSRRTNDNDPNGINDQVRLFRINTEGMPVSEAVYQPGTLWVEISDDEDDKRTLTYTDKQGKVVLKKSQDTADKESQGPAGWLSTYYVYDYFDLLRAVIPPQASKILADIGWDQSVNSTLANAQYFLYSYDARKRLIKKKVPGQHATHMVYDQQDRLVGFQDGNLAARESMNWLFTKYDGLGRIVRTGLTTDKRNREDLQAYLNTKESNNASTTAQTAHTRNGSSISSQKYDGYKVYEASKSISLRPGFRMKAKANQSFTARIGKNEQEQSAKAWPTAEEEILTVNYYDSYELLGDFPYKSPEGILQGFEAQPTVRVRGLQTGKKVKNLQTGDFYTSVMYYDEKGQLIQTLSEQQLGGIIRQSIAYNFEGQPTQTVIEQSHPSSLKIYRTMDYHVSGSLARIKHGVNIISQDQMQTLASYTYNDLGQQIAKSFSGDPSGNQTYAYNIRGWLTSLGSNGEALFKQNFYYNSGSEEKYYNGNIAGITWSGKDGKSRGYTYQYDNANRLLAAKFKATEESNRYSIEGISYDANGNILTMDRYNQKTKESYGKVDILSYNYETNDELGGSYSNRLLRVSDGLVTNTHQAKDFKPNTGSTENYSYDANGNQTSNPDKRISKISYNYLNLPESINFSTGGKISFAYDAEGNKRSQTIQEAEGKPSQTRDYIGEGVYLNGNLDYLIHEEGRVAYESNVYHYDFFVKDHLGNVRQVLRQPKTETKLATMESQHAAKEQANFSGLRSSRQTDATQNVTPGGDKVAWLNAGRGRILGPSNTQQINSGDSLQLRVFGKYLEEQRQSTKAAGFLSSGAKGKILNDLSEFSKSTQQAGAGNPITLLNMIQIVATDLQQKEIPEAYLLYALYDQDSNRYKVGKQPLSRKAANQHEILEEKLYISRDGYMETVVVNETAEDVWFDDFSISRTASLVIQETHYDPWGLELTGLGFQYGGVNENKYLYNGKEFLDDLSLNLFDYSARYFDPVIGRWTSPDPMTSDREWLSPYNYVQNNPLLRIDPDGMLDEYNYNIDSREFEWISDKGGDETQYVNVVNNEGDRFGQGSVSGSEVYAYKLKKSVVLTNFDVNFDDRTYNAKNNYEYSFSEFSLRNELFKSDDVISRYLKSSEKAGKAVPLTYSAEEAHYGYTSMRLKMMVSSIDQSFDAMPSFHASPKASKFGTTIREGGYISTGLKGNKGVTSLTNQTSWNRFLKANAGNYSGKGWQRRAAADYYKSKYYKK